MCISSNPRRWSVGVFGAFALAAVTACSSAGDATAANDGGVSTDASTSPWPGDPCSLLVDADFAMLSTPVKIASTNPANVGSSMYSPECHFYLDNADGTGSATMAVFVDLVSDFPLQKLVFKGTPVAGLGNDAWQGDAGGLGSATIGVLLDKWSFRVDSTYEFTYPDLTILAKAIATRLK